MIQSENCLGLHNEVGGVATAPRATTQIANAHRPVHGVKGNRYRGVDNRPQSRLDVRRGQPGACNGHIPQSQVQTRQMALAGCRTFLHCGRTLAINGRCVAYHRRAIRQRTRVQRAVEEAIGAGVTCRAIRLAVCHQTYRAARIASTACNPRQIAGNHLRTIGVLVLQIGVTDAIYRAPIR